MIIGIGIDVVEIRRIEAALGRKKFLEKVFTNREKKYCQSRGKFSTASYAARFAAKEAVAKAFGTGFSLGKIKDIEIINNLNGRPGVVLAGEFLQLAERIGVLKIHISLTHTKEYAAAEAVLWGKAGEDEDSKRG